MRPDENRIRIDSSRNWNAKGRRTDVRKRDPFLGVLTKNITERNARPAIRGGTGFGRGGVGPAEAFRDKGENQDSEEPCSFISELTFNIPNNIFKLI